MRILVTGGTGFIGRHLTRELIGHHNVWGFGLETADIRDWQTGTTQRYLDKYQPDVCVHLAARVGRLFGEDRVMETVVDNAGMTALVAQACGAAGVRLVYASTSEIYGDQGDHECVEDGDYDSSRIHNIYGLSKRHGEEICRLYAPRGLTIWRISMPYGPGLPAGRGRAAIVNMLYQADHREPISVHRGAERSWCWIGDTVRGMRLTIEQTKGGIFNIGRDDAGVSMLEVAQMACELTGAPESLIEEVPAPERQTVVKRLSTAKLRALGWKPEVELAEGMERTLAWVRETEAVAA